MPIQRLFLLFVLLAATSSVLAQPKVTVDHQTPTVKTRMFDRNNPPSDMPPLTGEEAAFCAYNLGASASVGYSLRTTDGPSGGCEAQWTEITLTLTCDIVIWLPRDFTPKLEAHEQAHRRIAERVYAQSKPLAEKLARDLGATEIKLEPGRCQESATESANRASNGMCDQWLSVTGRRAGAVNAAFDKITDHARNNTPEDEAIEAAFRQIDHPADR